MVKSQSEAASRYRTGIENFGGASTYKRCARQNQDSGFLQVAECLQSESDNNLSTDNMVTNYRNSA